jgi:aspartyl-tRNA(Asn)/glutamyl-tRNA(Gln) amidotransferase subunit A
VPGGFEHNHLLIWLQIMGKVFAEDMVLCVGHAYEQATEWHVRRFAVV